MGIDIDKIKKESSALSGEVWGKTIGYIVAALSLVAGLAWSDTIKAVLEYLFPISQKSIWLKIIYAALITLAVVIVSFYLTRALNKKSEVDKE